MTENKWSMLYFNVSMLLERSSYLQSSAQYVFVTCPQSLGVGGGWQGFCIRKNNFS